MTLFIAQFGIAAGEVGDCVWMPCYSKISTSACISVLVLVGIEALHCQDEKERVRKKERVSERERKKERGKCFQLCF